MQGSMKHRKAYLAWPGIEALATAGLLSLAPDTVLGNPVVTVAGSSAIANAFSLALGFVVFWMPKPF